MHSATLCLGSNIGLQSIEKINKAYSSLCDVGQIVCHSSVYGSASGYLNQVIVSHTSLDYDELLSFTKQLELNLGRRPQHKAQGIVPIDIDMVIYDEEVMRPLDYDSAYFNRGLEELHS